MAHVYVHLPYLHERGKKMREKKEEQQKKREVVK
jgi:hypothetical protein